MDKATAVAHGPGLLAGLASLWRQARALLAVRLELAVLELAEVRREALALLSLLACAALAAWCSVVSACALLVVWAWPRIGAAILWLLLLGFVLLAGALLWWARAVLARGKLGFPDTMAALRADRDALR